MNAVSRWNKGKRQVIGVRQGGVLSTSHYKIYDNPLPIQLEDKYIGMIIGSIQIPHITIADGLALLSTRKMKCSTCLRTLEGLQTRNGIFSTQRKVEC